ncbi:MAG: hypothetical protein EAZ78_07775 [Oscillatoriales cyanobacterium]|nr:MAG: hypothetical protein EA000_23490 [Oscillatoriales cyanobacterium]TAE01969.1 MAG: hypothetical protein EAZ98_02460 [Oscillatoriales cyanobacterium]TAF04733.1 MAG: hypothetical protein EAZ78_07775 [Oscillatoriales cyanobacterium]TAF62637.1 MAG: hypothetical protein EAZ59_23350 [Oscillatoriales cyanobacterium]
MRVFCAIICTAHHRCKVKSQSPAVEKQGLAMAPINKGDTPIMPYEKRLRPWLVVRLVPNLQRVVVGRFRSWSDAEGHLRVLKQLLPAARLALVFDPID